MWTETRWECRWSFRGILLLAVLGVAACGTPDLSGYAAEPDAVEARQIVELLAQGDLPAVEARLDESQRVPDPRPALRTMAAYFPKQPPSDVHLVGYQSKRVSNIGGSTTETSQVTFEWRFDQKWLLSQVFLRRVDGGVRHILGLHVQPLDRSVEEATAFSMRGKGAIHYGFLVIMLAVAATTVVALVSWFRQRRALARRWWWLIGILVGPFQISLDWATGAIDVRALTVRLFSLAATRSVMGSWILCFSIPAGALVFLYQTRRGWPHARQPPLDPPPVTNVSA